eukprot:208938-Rhodomonas_salina.2
MRHTTAGAPYAMSVLFPGCGTIRSSVVPSAVVWQPTQLRSAIHRSTVPYAIRAYTISNVSTETLYIYPEAVAVAWPQSMRASRAFLNMRSMIPGIS